MRLPAGPQTPSFVQFWQWLLFPLETVENRAKRYGDTFRARKDDPPLLYFSSPEALQTIFLADGIQLTSAEQSGPLRPLLGDHSLILRDGDYHRQQRKLLMPPFHGERMRAYGELIGRITAQVLQQIPLNQPFRVRSVTQRISLRVILSAVFGLHESDRYQELCDLLSEVLEGIASPFGSALLFYPALQRDLGPWSPWGKFLRRKRQIDKLLYAEIAQRKAEPDPNRSDILTMLLSARDEAGQPMTDVELRDELITLLFAGHETTASALAWALYWIHALPAVKTSLLAELDTIERNGDWNDDRNAIARLPYLSAVCQETLRLYPIAINAFPRIVKQPIEIDGYLLEPGAVLIPSIHLAHQRASVFPEPKQFRPERFLERQFSPYEYLPFGGGNRRCIGQAFALFEMKLVLAQILSQVELELLQNRPIKPVRRGLTIAPPSHLQMQITTLRAATL